MNILYVVDSDIEKPAFGNAQRTRLIYDALNKVGNVYILDVRPQGELWRDRRFLRLLPPKGWKRLVNAIWSRVMIKPWACFVPVYPFPCRWSIDDYFPGVKFDIAIARYLYHVGVMKLWNVAPKLYVDVDDYPMQVFDTVCAPNYNFVRRCISRLMNSLFVRFVLRKTTGCWIANPAQVPIVSRICKCELLRNVPFCVSADGRGEYTAQGASREYKEPFVFTVGLMGYKPNYKGVDVFLTTIWPQVREKLPNIRYKIVGKGLPAEFRVSWSRIPNVDILGYVEDLSELYRDCVATVVPVSEGGGTCIKTLESLANSRVCLSTPFGARGIPDEILDGGRTGIFVYESATGFVDTLARLLHDGEWRRKCEKIGKSYVDANYSIDQFEREVLGVISDNDTR